MPHNKLVLVHFFSWHAAVFLALLLFASSSWAAPQSLIGSWYAAPTDAGVYQLDSKTVQHDLTPVAGISLTGGQFWYEGEFELAVAGRYVLDFKNSSVIGLFRHRLYSADGRLVVTLEGGMQSRVDNPFFLRHGRELELPAGKYRLLTELSSPFYLAQPEPYLNTLADYRQAIKPGNALVLLSLGIFFGLGFYYTALALARHRLAEGMYALFILGNTLFNASAHLVLSDLFGLHWFYLISFPILFSNIAYIVFVMALLEIDKAAQPRLYRAGVAIIGLLLGFLLLALLQPNWSMELDRYGVGLFLAYGLMAGIVRARQAYISAKLYLIAIGVFFILGGVAISQSQLAGMYTIYIEHVGLLAVAVEVILLALVLAYQFAQLQREKETIQRHLEHSKRIAHTDALTGLPNRYVLEKDIERLPSGGSLTFIDIDRLKYYNDEFGHGRGDELLCLFSKQMASLLGQRATIYRVGGDEFGILSADGDVVWIESVLAQTISSMRVDFEFAGASAGSAHMHEAANVSVLKHLADMRMYENKQKNR